MILVIFDLHVALPIKFRSHYLSDQEKIKINVQDGGHGHFDLQSPRYFPPSFETTGLSVQKEKFIIEDDGLGGHFEFLIGTI